MNAFAPIALLLTPAVLVAAPRTSPNYTLNPEGLVPGGQSSSANYDLDGALDPSSGPIATSSNYSLKPGYVGQLYEVASLSVVAANGSVNEGATNQMSAAAVLDDSSTLPVDPTEVAWSIVSGPLSGVNAAGLAQTTPTFATMPATVRGRFGGLADTGSFTVRNVNPDDAPPVAGDGIDDDWQFDNFDANNDDELNGTEAANADPNGNPDNDPNTNIIEWLTGFDPNDPGSFFQWYVLDRSGTTLTAAANKVIPGTIFRLQTALDLENGPWVTVDTVSPGSEAFDQLFSDGAALDPAQWYRLELQKAP